MNDDPIPTLTYEAVKVSMNQTKDGIKITLVIHPNDIPADLLTDPVGSRYRVVMVLLDDHDQPETRAAKLLPTEGQHVAHRRSDQGNEAVMTSARLAKNPRFQQWMVEEGYALSPAEPEAAQGIRLYCGIESRAEIATSDRALRAFNDLRLAYSKTLPEEK